jgi:uncharacterized membrane protein
LESRTTTSAGGLSTESLSPTPAVARPGPAAIALALLFAAVFFAASLTPSLMPRSPIVQGLIGGVAAAVGYEIGNLLRWLWQFLELPQPPVRWHRNIRLVLYGIAAAIALFALWLSTGWMNTSRTTIGLDPVDTSSPLTILAVAAVAFAAMWGIFRLLGMLLRAIDRLLRRILPPKVSFALGIALVIWLTWALVTGVVGGAVIRAADSAYAVADSFVDPEIPLPTAPLKTGSEASLVNWQEMGRFGRDFIATAPTREEIAEFAGPRAMEPIRVYVGLRSAETARERAELALAELIRVGGFDRSYLILVSSTGTGWMDPGAQDSLDFMLGGDVATVVAQYSYLPSVLSLMANSEVGVDQARELFDVIYEYWTALPRDSRPKFYVHGLSLGAFNLQAALPLLDLLGDPMNGALWAGSPFFSAVWTRVRDARQSDSPAWRPVYGNSSLVRAMNQEGEADIEMAAWGPMRLVFLTYASDPLAAFAFGSAMRPPEWASDPRAFDIAPEFRWFPVVTMLQVALDTAFALNVPAYGHYYVAEHYIDAWSELLDPPGWNEAKEAELKAVFAERPLPM